MDIVTAIESRNSVRAYFDKQVPREVLEGVLETSLRTPSPTNIQPWNIYIASGQVLENMKRDNAEMFLASEKPSQEEAPLQGIYRERRIELAKDLFRLLKITREDKEKRREWATRGFRYFDAPTAIILTTNTELFQGKWAHLSIGSLMQTICLAALSYGLGTCICEQGVTYHSVLREYLHIPEEESIIISIALGYPDPDFLPNQYKSPRASLDEVSHWNGF